jgi:hypothetical protein
MTGATFAHAGHWLVQLAYLTPLVLLVVMLVVGKLRERRRRHERAAEGVGDR